MLWGRTLLTWPFSSESHLMAFVFGCKSKIHTCGFLLTFFIRAHAVAFHERSCACQRRRIAFLLLLLLDVVLMLVLVLLVLVLVLVCEVEGFVAHCDLID